MPQSSQRFVSGNDFRESFSRAVTIPVPAEKLAAAGLPPWKGPSHDVPVIPVWKTCPYPSIKAVIARDTTCCVSLLTGTTGGSNFAIPST